jgi:hypothetical protein
MSDRNRKLIKSYQKEENWQHDKMMKEDLEMKHLSKKNDFI